MIEIVGPTLYKWDTGRSVRITGNDAEYVHFANKGNSKAVIIGVVNMEAKIPDFLLQTGKQLCVYAVTNGITLESRIFPVKYRERPENYVYEDDQRNYIYELIKDVETAVNAANHAAAEANAAAEKANNAAQNSSQLPPVTEEDNGKVMQVVDGEWAAAELPVYDGEFEVTPSATDDQTLLTAQKYMNANIIVNKIPYSEVSNNSGGTTAYIGG